MRVWKLAGVTVLGTLAIAITAQAAGLNLVNTTPQGSKQVASITWNQQEEPTGIDPAKSATQLENPTVANLCESLILQTPDGKYAPGLATSWSNPNSLTWVYKIRKGVKFWDGKTMTAEDVAYSLNRHLDPKVGSYWSFFVRNVKSFTVTGPYEVTMKLKRPDYLVNQEMSDATSAVSEKAFVEKAGADYGTPKVGVMCTGPFKFDSWTHGQSLTIVRNDDYWNKKLLPKVKKITWKYILDEATATNALLTGEIDGAYQAPISGVPKLQASKTGKLYLGRTAVMLDLLVTNNTSPLKDPKIRKAISLAIDRQAISTKVFQGVTRPSKALVADGWWDLGGTQYANYFKSIPNPKVDLTQAKKLVKQAGSPKKQIVIAAEPLATYKQLTEIVAAAARSIGLNVKVNVVPPGGTNELWFDAKARKKTDAFVATWYTNIPDPLENMTYFLPGGSYNYANYDNPKLTKLVNDAVATKDPAARAAKGVAALKILDNELPWIPLIEQPNRLYMNNRISGATASLTYLYRPWAATIGGTK